MKREMEALRSNLYHLMMCEEEDPCEKCHGCEGEGIQGALDELEAARVLIAITWRIHEYSHPNKSGCVECKAYARFDESIKEA